MADRLKLAVIILTYNEMLHLGRALDSIAGLASEIFIVDSGSTDGTVELARSRGAQIFTHDFENQARQFQWALENLPVTADWVMRLDADEIIEPDLAAQLQARLPLLPPSINGISLNRKTIFMNRWIRHGGRYPLWMLRVWRRGTARMEDRWMDEHLYLTEGQSIEINGGFADWNLHDLTFFTAKHNHYASREALDVLNRRHHIFAEAEELTHESTAGQVKIKRFIKEKIYNRVPFSLATLGYFLLRYVVQRGFLDGREGLIYNVLQGFWYRFLVGAKLCEMEEAVAHASNREELIAKLEDLTGRKLQDGPLAANRT